MAQLSHGVGHTHEDIDGLFGVLSSKLRNQNAFTTKDMNALFGEAGKSASQNKDRRSGVGIDKGYLPSDTERESSSPCQNALYLGRTWPARPRASQPPRPCPSSAYAMALLLAPRPHVPQALLTCLQHACIEGRAPSAVAKSRRRMPRSRRCR